MPRAACAPLTILPAAGNQREGAAGNHRVAFISTGAEVRKAVARRERIAWPDGNTAISQLPNGDSCLKLMLSGIKAHHVQAH